MGDLWSLNNWVVRDYYRLVDSVNGLEQSVRGLSDEQVVSTIFFNLWFMVWEEEETTGFLMSGMWFFSMMFAAESKDN